MTVRGADPLPPRAGPIVDADGHVLEPESAWSALPARYRPRISADGSGYEHVVVGDTEILGVPLGVRRGHEDILRYYTEHTFVFEDFRPDPGPLRVDGTTVTVDIDVHLGGADRSVRDVFETDGERITSLQVRGFADVLRAAEPR